MNININNKDKQTLFLVANLWTIFAWYSNFVGTWTIAALWWGILSIVVVRDVFLKERIRAIFKKKEVLTDGKT